MHIIVQNYAETAHFRLFKFVVDGYNPFCPTTKKRRLLWQAPQNLLCIRLEKASVRVHGDKGKLCDVEQPFVRKFDGGNDEEREEGKAHKRLEVAGNAHAVRAFQ